MNYRDLDGHILQGIARPSTVGFLTLVEWYRQLEVGNFYKNPRFPVWVICSESHYTTLFAADQRAVQGAAPFDLFYYDGLARQDGQIRLTLRRTPGGSKLSRIGDSYAERSQADKRLGMTPPLEMVLDCRWAGCDVDWNGAEPIL